MRDFRWGRRPVYVVCQRSPKEGRPRKAMVCPTVRLAACMLLWLPAKVMSEGGQPLVLVADSRRFPGWIAWWSNLYNESHLYLALLTVVVIPGLALVMAKVTDFILSRIGINLKSRVLAEH